MNDMNARKVASDVLIRVEKEGAYSHIALKEALREGNLSPRDRGLVTELVNGTIRNRATLDHVVDSFLKKRNLRPEIRSVLRMGVYQLLYMNKIPVSAAVNESVKLVHLYRMNSQKGLVNAVLRNVDRNRSRDFFSDLTDPVRKLAVTTSHPEWMVSLFIRRFGPENAQRLLEYNNRPAPSVIRINTLRTDEATLRRELEEAGFTAEPGPAPQTLVLGGRGSVNDLRAYREGHFMVQSPSSVLAAVALGARPDETILDCCAAPGGKTFVLAQDMKDRGTILATDVHEHKMELIRKGAAFLGITCVDAQVRDWTRDQPDLEQRYDRVLVDAPCTGLGMLSKRPDLRWRKEQGDIPRLVGLQRNILSTASRSVRPGGILLYSTCTLTQEENGDQRQWFLERFPDFEPWCPGLEEMFPAGKDQEDLKNGHLEITPFAHGMEGFYLAVFRRRST